MRGKDQQSDSLFSYIRLETRIPADRPLRPIRKLVGEALVALSPAFSKLYAREGRPSIPPERLLRALLLPAFYTVHPYDFDHPEPIDTRSNSSPHSSTIQTELPTYLGSCARNSASVSVRAFQIEEMSPIVVYEPAARTRHVKEITFHPKTLQPTDIGKPIRGEIMLMSIRLLLRIVGS